MSSTSAAVSASPKPLLGVQTPRILRVPGTAISSAGEEAVDLAKLAGLELDPWEALTLEHALGQRRDGKWSAFEVGLIVSRQNGKGSILEARELAGLFLLKERLIVHTAHEFPTSLEAFHRLLQLIEGTPEFSRRVKRVSKSHGEEGIELMTGQRIRFRTRTGAGGRGFTADCLILDEAMILALLAIGALLPTLSARPNPQVWYVGSAVDKLKHLEGIVLSLVRARALAGDEDALLWLEWSAPGLIEKAAEILDDRGAWATANPGLGIRISEEHISRERRAMDARTFAVERLSIGDWFQPNEDANEAINVEKFVGSQEQGGCTDINSKAENPICFAFDVRPDRGAAAIGIAGIRADGLDHIEIIAHKAGTYWVGDRLAELVKKHPTAGPPLFDSRSPAAALVTVSTEAGKTVHKVGDTIVKPLTTTQYTAACGAMFDAVEEATLRHLGTEELTSAVRGAERRNVGEAWAWSRKNSSVDITPLVVTTIARWGFHQAPTQRAGAVLI